MEISEREIWTEKATPVALQLHVVSRICYNRARIQDKVQISLATKAESVFD